MAMRDILDIKPALPLSGQWDWAWYALLGLGLVAAGLALRHGWTRPGQREKRLLRRALRRLETDAAGLDDREFAYRLAGLLRQVLAWRTGIPAPTMTTEEILPLLSRTNLPVILQQTVADTLSHADHARYAAPTTPPLRGGSGGSMPPGRIEAAPQSPEASSPPRTGLATVNRLLGRGWVWSR